MEFVVGNKKFTDYNEAQAYEKTLREKEAEAQKQAELDAKKEAYIDEITNQMEFCVVDFDNKRMTSPRPRLIFAFMTETAKNKSDFVTMANAYIEEACERRFYINKDGSYGKYYNISFLTAKSKGYDEMNSVACGAVLDYLLNNGHAFSTSGKFIPVDEELGVMFFDLTWVDKDECDGCQGCSCKGYDCSTGEEISYDDLPDEVKAVANLLGRLFG